MANEIDDTTEFYRDNLRSIMKWGVVAFLAMAGWLLSGPPNEERFSFAVRCSIKYDRAIGLLVLCVLSWPAWLLAVIVAKFKCYKHDDNTVPSWGYIIPYCLIVLLGVFIMMSLVLDWEWYLVVLKKIGL